jgi:GntR family transcriptional regulator
VLSTKIGAPDRATQDALKLGASDYVIEIQRVRLADGSPISLEDAQFPAHSVPGLLEQPLGGSLSAILESEYGLTAGGAVERIYAVTAIGDEAALLGIKPKSALLLITRVIHDQNGTPYEFSRDVFRGDRIALAVAAQGRGSGGTAAKPALISLQRPTD